LRQHRQYCLRPHTQKLCVTDGPNDPAPVCVTKAQLTALLSQSSSQSFANPSPATSTSSTDPTASGTPWTIASTSPAIPPVLSINGDNPAIIHVGDTYADLGATITGPQADKNLDIKTYLNGLKHRARHQ
jgi:hypothetical protein